MNISVFGLGNVGNVTGASPAEIPTLEHDVRHPPVTVVGHNHAADAAGTMALYDGLDAPLVSTSVRVAEMVK
jgi:UDP-glucose 6-dehydrogenase